MEVPEYGERLWEWFWDISRDRQSGMNGPQPIGPVGIMAWSAVTGNVIRGDEAEILRAMDGAYLRAMSNEAREQSAKYQQTAAPAKP